MYVSLINQFVKLWKYIGIKKHARFEVFTMRRIFSCLSIKYGHHFSDIFYLTTCYITMLCNTRIEPYLLQHSLGNEWFCIVWKKLCIKSATRVITSSGWNAHSVPLFKCKYILKLKEINTFQIACFVYDEIHNTWSVSFKNYFITNIEKDVKTHSTAHSYDIHILQGNTNIGAFFILKSKALTYGMLCRQSQRSATSLIYLLQEVWIASHTTVCLVKIYASFHIHVIIIFTLFCFCHLVCTNFVLQQLYMLRNLQLSNMGSSWNVCFITALHCSTIRCSILIN